MPKWKDPTKPASRPIAMAIQSPEHPGSWNAFIGAPGQIPFRLWEDGKPRLFNDRENAHNAALMAVFELFCQRATDTRKPKDYVRRTPEQFASLLSDAGITIDQFCHIYGVPESRGAKWMSGEQDIPPGAAVLCELLIKPSNREWAKNIADTAWKGRS